eukprot:c10833_g1_i2.p1 GENE.c10833_g1_i2~~c10833_g1_i2.p1  ORF type:complete len:116 (+),score=30.33 c10833_g1_i2:36-383(+)
MKLFGYCFGGNVNSNNKGPQDNVFTKMTSGKIPANFLYSDSEIIVIEDKEPAGEYHYLIIPREFIEHVGKLKPVHLKLVQHMWDVGKRLLEEKGIDPNDAIIAFHKSPFFRHFLN